MIAATTNELAVFPRSRTGSHFGPVTTPIGAAFLGQSDCGSTRESHTAVLGQGGLPEPHSPRVPSLRALSLDVACKTRKQVKIATVEARLPPAILMSYKANVPFQFELPGGPSEPQVVKGRRLWHISAASLVVVHSCDMERWRRAIRLTALKLFVVEDQETIPSSAALANYDVGC